MVSLTTRRLVTGHNPEGKAIIVADEVLTSLNPMTAQPISGSIAGITNICKTEGFPAKVDATFVDWHGKPLGLTDESGAICRLCHFPPVLNSEEDKLNILHRTQSIDFGVVLEGEILLTLDDGFRTTMRNGDVVVQRGTIHDWTNESDSYCVMLFVLVPSNKPQVEKTGEVLEPILPPMPTE